MQEQTRITLIVGGVDKSYLVDKVTPGASNVPAVYITKDLWSLLSSSAAVTCVSQIDVLYLLITIVQSISVVMVTTAHALS